MILHIAIVPTPGTDLLTKSCVDMMVEEVLLPVQPTIPDAPLNRNDNIS